MKNHYDNCERSEEKLRANTNNFFKLAKSDIIQYIEANKSRFSLEALLDELRKNGYPENEIQEALNAFNSSSPQTAISTAVLAGGAATGKNIGAWIGGFLASFALFVIAAGVVGFFLLMAALGGHEEIFFFAAAISGSVLLILHAAAWKLLRGRWPHFVRGVVVSCIVFGIIAGAIGTYVYWEMQQSRARNRMSSRDARRISDIRQIQLGLDIFVDAKGFYPDNLDAMIPQYLPAMSNDPETNMPYYYERRLDGGYYMRAELENANNYVLRNDVNPDNMWYEIEGKVLPPVHK